MCRLGAGLIQHFGWENGYEKGRMIRTFLTSEPLATVEMKTILPLLSITVFVEGKKCRKTLLSNSNLLSDNLT